VIDGRGRWVGLNFDRVWENVAGDFGYSTERSRNVVVDVRYLLWVLDEVAHADELLVELGVGESATPPAADATASPTSVAEPARAASEVGLPLSAAPAEPGHVAASCSCTHEGTSDPIAGVLLVAIAVQRRRRRSDQSC